MWKIEREGENQCHKNWDETCFFKEKVSFKGTKKVSIFRKTPGRVLKISHKRRMMDMVTSTIFLVSTFWHEFEVLGMKGSRKRSLK